MLVEGHFRPSLQTTQDRGPQRRVVARVGEDDVSVAFHHKLQVLRCDVAWFHHHPVDIGSRNWPGRPSQRLSQVEVDHAAAAPLHVDFWLLALGVADYLVLAIDSANCGLEGVERLPQLLQVPVVTLASRELSGNASDDDLLRIREDAAEVHDVTLSLQVSNCSQQPFRFRASVGDQQVLLQLGGAVQQMALCFGDGALRCRPTPEPNALIGPAVFEQGPIWRMALLECLAVHNHRLLRIAPELARAQVDHPALAAT
mmetsp:Transcript_100980/g.292108  ORF Transcript_100980/g.292108 Transcript_100980/m.292108 type:complete len:257 (-) Transcript_100980:411-1181(-)